MEELPTPIVIDILSRLPDCSDLARCRLVSKTLNSLSRHVTSLRMLCSNHRPLPASFRSLITDQILLLDRDALESLSLIVERPFAADDDYEDGDDLHLTGVDFVAAWLPAVASGLQSLEIGDFWAQSCWRASEVLALISRCCERLVNLELRYAWLSVEGLKPLPSLKSLTLEFIRLDDEYLAKINECFPCLEVLQLIGVGGLTEPKIHLLHLKTCLWTVSNFPLSLSITAPNLIDLKLRCVEQKSLVLRTPSLSSLNLTIEKHVDSIDVGNFLNLRSVRIQTPAITSTLQIFTRCTTVQNLEIESSTEAPSAIFPKCICFDDLIRSFPCLRDLKLSLEAWCQLENSFGHGGSSVSTKWDSLKKLVLHLPPSDFTSSASFVLDTCTTICDVMFLVSDDIRTDIHSRCISKFAKIYPNVKWRWALSKR